MGKDIKRSRSTNSINAPDEFMGLQPHEFQDAYYLYLDLVAASSDKQTILSSLTIKIVNAWNIVPAAAPKIAEHLYKQFSSPLFSTKFMDSHGLEARAFMSSVDYERYISLTSADPHSSPALRSFLLALIVNYRRNFHKSGWVKYDRKSLVYLSDIGAMSIKDQEELTCYLHTEYGLNMQVVGSNSPTPCYKIDWLFNQSQPGSHINPFYELGPLTPATIHKVASGELIPSTSSLSYECDPETGEILKEVHTPDEH